MGLHKSFDRQFVLLGGAVKVNGGSLDLSRGEVGFFDTENVTENGATAISSFKGMPQSQAFEIRYRETDDAGISRSKSSKTFKSFPFSLEDVLELRVSTPKITEATVDEVVVGWNGIDDSTALSFRRGESKNATIELSGEAIGYLGYPDAKVQIPMFFDAGSRYLGDCDAEADFCAPLECTKIVENAIDVVKQFKLRGGVPVTDYMEISPIRSCAPVEVETTDTFYSLTLCDVGDDSALALVRQQYPNARVERTNRVGAISTYELLQPTLSAAPVAFNQTLPSIIKGCKDCPTGYVATSEGYVYVITLEDAGIDKTSLVEALPNLVADSVIKADGQVAGQGFYTVVLSKKLTKAQVATFVDTNDTATVDYISSVEALCTNATITTTAWVIGSTLTLSKRDFYIDLPDTNCDGLSNRLAELQSAYPTLTVELEGTTGGCQTRYKTSVKTNRRGEVCDPIFLDSYSAEAPLPYENRMWKAVEVENAGEDCLCGFKVKGKLLQIFPTECVIDDIAFVEDSVKIRVSGGWISDIREGIGAIEDNPFNVEQITYASKRTHMGYALRNFEKQSRTHFSGDVNSSRGNIEKFIRGVESNLNYEAQYVDYSLLLRRQGFSQGMGQMSNAHTTFHFQVEVGRQGAIEAVLNSLAAQAGKSGVKAFG